MKQRMLVEAGGPKILNPGEGPDNAGFMPMCIPSHDRPQATFGIPISKIPKELIAPMLKPGAHVYADVDFEPPESDPDIVIVFGFHIGENLPVSIANLALVKPT